MRQIGDRRTRRKKLWAGFRELLELASAPDFAWDRGGQYFSGRERWQQHR